MIISHKNKFIFVKTRKTAGTSIEIALSKICGIDDIITPISKIDEDYRNEFANISAQNYNIPFNKYTRVDFIKLLGLKGRKRFYNHMTCPEIKSNIPIEIWNEYYKFTIDRNPFDKIVSLYYWRGGNKRFNNIYDFLTKGGLRNWNSYDIYSIDGIKAVDQIYKYENIESICADLTRRLKLKEPLQLPSRKAKSNIRKTRNYKDILDENSIALIKVIFAREIELFGYEY